MFLSRLYFVDGMLATIASGGGLAIHMRCNNLFNYVERLDCFAMRVGTPKVLYYAIIIPCCSCAIAHALPRASALMSISFFGVIPPSSS